MQVKSIAECSAILSTFIKLPFVIKIFVLSFFGGRFTQVLLYAFFCIQINFYYAKSGFILFWKQCRFRSASFSGSEVIKLFMLN